MWAESSEVDSTRLLGLSILPPNINSCVSRRRVVSIRYLNKAEVNEIQIVKTVVVEVEDSRLSVNAALDKHK